MSFIIDLLRHGDVAGGTKLLGQCDESLSELGWRQLRSVVEGVIPPWDRIISSPLQRCRAFAEELSGRFCLPLTLEPDFCEIGFGAWDGRLFSELYESAEAEYLLRFWRNPIQYSAPEGEPYEAFEQRVFSAWQTLLENGADGQHCLLITHGGVIRTILRHVLGFPVENFFRIDIPYASLSRIQVESPEFPRLLFLDGRLSR